MGILTRLRDWLSGRVFQHRREASQELVLIPRAEYELLVEREEAIVKRALRGVSDELIYKDGEIPPALARHIQEHWKRDGLIA